MELCEACWTGDLEKVTRLIAAGSHVDEPHEGSTPLQVACCAGQLRVVRFLIKQHANVNVANDDGWTPLHEACRKRNLPMGLVLVIQGAANVNVATDRGWTPLHEACDKGHSEMVRFLVDRGANIDVFDSDGQTPLLTAIDRLCLYAVPCHT